MSVPGYRPCWSGPGPWVMDRLPSLILALPRHYGLAWWLLDSIAASTSLVTTLGSWLTLFCGPAGPCCSLTLTWSVEQKAGSMPLYQARSDYINTGLTPSRLTGTISPSAQALSWMKVSAPNTMQQKASAALWIKRMMVWKEHVS